MYPLALWCYLLPPLRGSNVFKQPIGYPGLRFAPPWAKTLPPLRGSCIREQVQMCHIQFFPCLKFSA